MYHIYNVTKKADVDVYNIAKKGICLFGCNQGIIPALLRLQTKESQNQPYPWHVCIAESPKFLNDEYGHNSTIIIDLKPKQHKDNVSLYNLLDVWGYSNDEWTPIMLRLRALYTDENPEKINRECFTIEHRNPDDIYEFLYINGSVSNGKLTGRWTAPPASPTNGALLWPESFKYFLSQVSITQSKK